MEGVTIVTSDIKVTSHVGRDLLAAASVFKTEESVVWEYVVNSLQYVDRGISPIVNVQVHPRARTITISDNGQGMSEDDLRHFFTMHAENRERRTGRPGRGKFGTGKSAAFGIAKSLQIETIHNSLYNKALLTRDHIDQSDGRNVPLDWVVRNEPSELPNGTTVTIDDIQLSRIDSTAITEYIERNLAFFRGSNPQVAVNNHVCEYHEPRITFTRTYNPSLEQATVIGDVLLTIKVAQAPLREFEQGIAITAGSGNLLAIERAGIERKEYGNYLFGEVDVPKLEESTSAIAPIDPSRNLQLNPRHPEATVLISFIGSKLDEVRGELVAEDRKRRQTAQARQLAAESAKIAELLNKDFEEMHLRLNNIRSVTSRRGSVDAQFGNAASAGEDDDKWISGIDEPGTLVDREKGKNGDGTGQNKGAQRPKITRTGHPDPAGLDPLSPAGGVGSKHTKPQGGFAVDYQRLGPDTDRSVYDQTTLTILINLDHPTVDAALESGGVDNVAFRRLSYEIAFTEYAIALGYEAAREDPEIEADDLLFDVRRTMNRVARAAAELYR